MFKQLFLYTLLITLCFSCNGNGEESSGGDQGEEAASAPFNPSPLPPDADVPVAELPQRDGEGEVSLPNPPPSEQTWSLHPSAGKVSLWNRSVGYDAAVFLPSDYDNDPTKLYPMILSLHGLNGSVLNIDHTAVGGKKTGFIKQVWGTTLAKTYKAIVIAPDETPAGTTTTGLWDHTKLRQLILDARKKYKVDPDRIVVTGLSAGSIATQQLIKYSKDLVAAAMPGAYNEDVVSTNPCVMADIPVWVFGNNSDNLFDSNDWSSFDTKVRSCSNHIHEFTLTIYNNTCGHGCWDSHWARKDVQDWLIQQRK